MAYRKKRGRKWLVCWTSPSTGRERSRGGFPNAAEAERFKVEVEGLVARGLDWEPPRPVVENEAALNVGTAVAAYLDHVELTKARLTARQRTMSLKLFRDFLTATAPTSTMASLSKALLTSFVRWLKQPETSQRGGRGDDHVRKTVEHVQLFWAWAADDDERFAAVTPPPRKLADLRGLRSPRTPTRAPTWADMDAVIAALGSPDVAARGTLQRDIVHHVLVAAVLRCTGLRISQTERLLVGDVDVGAGVLTFRGELGKSHQERSGRLLPLAPVLLPVLARLVAGRAPSAPLVPSRSQASAQNRRERMADAWRRAGVPEAIWKQRVNHAFRKGFSSELARNKITVEIRDFLTGHSGGLAGIYTDPDAHDLRGAVATVAPFSSAAAAAIEAALSTTNTTSGSDRTQDGPNA